jgi:hypothetical protein
MAGRVITDDLADDGAVSQRVIARVAHDLNKTDTIEP